ncbi:MAG: restriction endonuclease subunit S [Candidatus Thiodiazotropha sp.]
MSEAAEKIDLAELLAKRRTVWEKLEFEKIKQRNIKTSGDKWKSKYKEPADIISNLLSELPQGWIWASVAQIGFVISGQTPKGIADVKEREGIPWFKVGDMNTEGNEHNIKKAETYLTPDQISDLKLNVQPEGTIIFPKRGGAILTNKKRILAQPSAYDLNTMGVYPVGVEKKYLWYWFLSLNLGSLSDGSNVPQINHGDIEPLPVPVAPSDQQKRIVAKIEELFSHIDAGIEALKKAKQLLKQYRQSALKAAVTGELTKEWREESEGVDIDGLPGLIAKHLGNDFTKYQEVEDKKGWIKVVLKDISSRVSVGHVGKTSEFYCDESEGVPFLRSQNVRPGRVVFEGTRYIAKEFHDSLKKSQLQEGDLLIVRVGANRGDAAVMPKFEGDINCANIVFARTPKGLGGYLDVYFQSKLWTDLVDSITTGSAQGVINTKTVEKVKLEIPPLVEMKKILELVEEKSSGISRLEDEIDSQLIKADISKQSVLASAFSGQI